jgi:hypothetical protein
MPTQGRSGLIARHYVRRLAFVATLLVLWVVLSRLANPGAPEQILAGKAIEYEHGQWIGIANERTDPGGVRIRLREATIFDGQKQIERGAPVIVWYRSLADRHPIADRVRVLLADAR